MSEFTQTFKDGTWVTGESTDGHQFDIGLVISFDSGDGEHLVATEPKSLHHLGIDDDCHRWCRPDDIETADPPDWVAPKAPHAFAIDWTDDGVPNVALYSSAEAVQEAFASIEDPDPNLQLKLMESVADPGERFDLPIKEGQYGVRFLMVVGA